MTKARPLRAAVSSADGAKKELNGNDNGLDDSPLRRRLSVAAILASAFLNLLGFTMAGPITPALGQHFDLAVGASFGSLTSAYPAGMLVGLFLWPQLSDRIGRKPVVTASLLGSGLGLAAQAHAIRSGWSLPHFLATRVLTGSFAGSSPVSKAFLADAAQPPSKLPQYLALRDAACTMAFIVGPVLGGILFDARAASAVQYTSASLAFVIGTTSAASLAAAALVALLVQETPNADRRQSKQQPENSISEKSKDSYVACPLGVRLWTGVATVCVVSFLFNVGDSTFHAFFPSLLRSRCALDTRSIGMTYTGLAVVSLLMSTAAAARNFTTRLGPVLACAVGLSAAATGLLMLARVSIPWLVLVGATLYYCGVPLYGPSIPTMLLRCVPPRRRGAVMGLDGAINTIGRVIAPVIMGELYRRRGATAAFGLAGSTVLSAAGLALVRRFMVIRGGGGKKRIKNN